MISHPRRQPRRTLAGQVNAKFKAWVKRRRLEHEFPDYTMRNSVTADIAKAQRDQRDKEEAP